MVILLAFCIVVSVTTIIYASSRVSAAEKAEEKVNKKINEVGKFKDAKEVKLDNSLEGESGKYDCFTVYNSAEEDIGFVSTFSSTGEITSVYHGDHILSKGEPKITKEEAKKKSKAYAADWGKAISDDYVLTREDLHLRGGDMGGIGCYVYLIDWENLSDDVSIIGDTSSFEIDAIDGEIIYCSFPMAFYPKDELAEKAKPRISEKEAFSIAKPSIPSPEEWYSTLGIYDLDSVKIEVVDNSAKKRFGPVPNGIDQPTLMWELEIIYRAYPKNIKNDLGPEEATIYVFIEAMKGEVLSEMHTM